MLLVLLVILVAVLITVGSVRPIKPTMSTFERRRRANLGDVAARDLLRRDQLLGGILSLQRIIIGLAIAAIANISIVIWAWGWGLLVILAVVIGYGTLGRLRPIRTVASRLYNKYENKLLGFVARFPVVFRVIGISDISGDTVAVRFDSREELQHLIVNSNGVLTVDEKRLLDHGLSFGDKLVGSIMVPRSAIDTIKKTELLGPLTLDDLHKTGHSRIPVIDSDIDHIIGILQIRSLLALDIKRSLTAEKAMEPRVYYIREDQTLQHALAAFLRTHHHLFIVVNEFRETVGLLTLEDVIEALLGRRIIDEFDAHDDLRVVALRNLHDNNHPKNLEDV